MGNNVIHEKKLSFLKRAFLNGRLHHVYLFYGPEGSGKFSFALSFVKYIQCINKENNKACLKCENCKKSSGDFLVDTHVINHKLKQSEGLDKKIHIEEIREGIRFLGLSSSSGNKKVLVINDIHNISDQAGEALLKTLEEPPGDSLIILLASDKRSIPQTIISRCHCVFFPLVTKENLLKDIDQEISNNDLFDISHICNAGSLDFIDELKEKENPEAKYNKIISELEILADNKLFSKIVFAKEINEKNFSKQNIKNWLAILYNIFLYKNRIIDWNDKERSMLINLEKKLSYDKIKVMLEKLLDVLTLFESNVNKKILIENFILEI